MEINEIATLLSNYCFPVVCVIAMFNMLNKEREDHKTEARQMTEAINNNTTVLEKILTKLGVE